MYEGCECPSAAPTVCNDDGCGVGGFESRVEFTAQAGQSYMIRVGGFEGDQGDGFLNILCDVNVCGANSGDCAVANGSRGCNDADCCETTCAVDPFCCDVDWDGICAAEAEGLCDGSFEACAAGAGSCGEANDSAGCDDVDCCNRVCMEDPFCCVDTWDGLCEQQANGLCALTCGAPDTGSCFATNPTPGCDNVSCCELVCAEDPFCCDTQWDDECETMARTLCR